MTRYVYQHPQQAGLGQHHADGPLEARPADVYAPAALGQLAAVLGDLTPEQEARLAGLRDLTMADLDMPHGTQCTIRETLPDGYVVLEWVDAQCDARATSIEPSFFSSYFTEA
jgi:hypothetical protein